MCLKKSEFAHEFAEAIWHSIVIQESEPTFTDDPENVQKEAEASRLVYMEHRRTCAMRPRTTTELTRGTSQKARHTWHTTRCNRRYRPLELYDIRWISRFIVGWTAHGQEKPSTQLIFSSAIF